MNREKWRLFPRPEGVAPYFLLINLIIPMYFLLHEPSSIQWLGFVLLGLFALLFRQFYFNVKRAPQILMTQVGILLILAAVFNPMYTFIGFMIAAPLSKQKMPILLSITIVFPIVMGAIAVPYLDQAGSLSWIGLVPIFGVCILPYIIRTSIRFQQKSAQLRAETTERMAQQEERQRIARELHDTLGHTLSLIALKGEVVEKLVNRHPERAMQEAREIRETARAALKQMRELVTEMKVAYFADEYKHAVSLCSTAGISLTLQYQSVSNLSPSEIGRGDALLKNQLPLTPLQETILAMCFRESITNVVRHSGATKCNIHLDIQEGEVRVSVSDDGIGVDADQLYTSSNGIAGLRQRLVMIDGHMSLTSSSGKGTNVTLHIPRVIRNEKVGNA
ncbi:sensor histidine kinase [Paenibacillus sp. PAMC21692]|uniref:sensor histidine kinase n=1 Tax=Paenibacillus sp. PAMC21692 TaxID=2762320 RepID=UPI00164E8DEE|nr:sensor histidine kinase [Paenibacillus sp. PAMC21692]QNK57406.1 sensor histidine kinase [Paenibacillus sp. PAMC21692]